MPRPRPVRAACSDGDGVTCDDYRGGDDDDDVTMPWKLKEVRKKERGNT